jgi:hypothetical protein
MSRRKYIIIKNLQLNDMYRTCLLTAVLLTVCSLTVRARTDKYVSTGYCRFLQGAWEKSWTSATDASFSINIESGELRFDHTVWAPHSLKIDRIENSKTEEGSPLIIYHCTEPEADIQ